MGHTERRAEEGRHVARDQAAHHPLPHPHVHPPHPLLGDYHCQPRAHSAHRKVRRVSLFSPWPTPTPTSPYPYQHLAQSYGHTYSVPKQTCSLTCPLPSLPRWRVILLSPEEEEEGPPKKKPRQTKEKGQLKNPNLTAMQAHCFHLLRPLSAVHVTTMAVIAS